MTSFISPTLVRWLVVLLLGIILTLDVASMRHMTVTYDEPTHFRYGQNVLNLDSNRFNDSTMPVTALNALPARLGVRLSPGPLETGRYVTVLFSLLVALCVFAWARDLYGPTAGLLALTLYTFDPSLLAHSQLVTTDLYALGMMTFSLYFFWRFLQRGGWSRAMLSGVVLGVSQLVKYTAVFLFPLFAVIAIGFYAPDMWRSAQERRFDDLRRRLARFSGYALLFLALSLMTINAGFLFDRTFTPLADFPFRSDLFRSIQSSLAKAGTLPVPVLTRISTVSTGLRTASGRATGTGTSTSWVKFARERGSAATISTRSSIRSRSPHSLCCWRPLARMSRASGASTF